MCDDVLVRRCLRQKIPLPPEWMYPSPWVLLFSIWRLGIIWVQSYPHTLWIWLAGGIREYIRPQDGVPKGRQVVHIVLELVSEEVMTEHETLEAEAESCPVWNRAALGGA